MASAQERLKLKRPPCDTWSIREQLCLASSVLKSGDQNWMSVSRSLKSFVEKESQRPPDWFSQKSCAVQYAQLLENADTPKRKKRETSETIGESIVRRLTQERMAELGQILTSQRDEYQQIKTELNLLKSGNLSEEKLQKMCLTIELEEREQEQKGKAHTDWLAKRQKQEGQAPQTLGFSIQRKSESSEGHDTLDPATDEEEKKNKGGRSPLLTSLLKSPSPTTQIQSQNSSAQVTSPTIASLLGSSPKIPNPQLTQTVSPQLHQLVSTAIANAAPERPSAGAPTLSMLLELPANLQRTTLPNLQPHTSTTSTLPQQNIDLQLMQIENQRGNIQIMEPPMAPGNMSASEIIDHIDEVIPKDIMADVIDKDEINEIIGDIEELIKGEIPDNPQVLDPRTAGVMESLNLPQPQLVPERQITNVQETVSLSDSPESEIAIEEIDSSTSNIAEIIGTVAIEPKIVPQESKIADTKSGDEVKSEASLESSDESKNEKAEEAAKNLRLTVNSEAVNETRLEGSKEETTEVKEDTKKSSKEDAKKSAKEDTKKSLKEDAKNSVKEEAKKSIKEEVKKTIKEEVKKSIKEEVKKSIKEEVKKSIKEEVKKSIKEEIKKSSKEEAKQPVREEAKKETKEELRKAVKESAKKEEKENLKKDTKENSKKEKNEETKKDVPVLGDLPDEKLQSTSEKQNSSHTKFDKELEGETNKSDFDQLELNLAKITGDQGTSSAEALSVSSNDSPENEDTEKSQDISLILEDEEILPSHQEKKKGEEEVVKIESATDGTEYSESSKEEVIVIKEDSEEVEREKASEKVKEQSKEVVDVEVEDFKRDETKDSSDVTSNTEVLEDDLKDEEEEELQGKTSAIGEREDPLKESEKFPEDENLNKEEDIKFDVAKVEDEFQEEASTDEAIKSEKEIKDEKDDKDDKKNVNLDESAKKDQTDFSESVGELDEEESTLSKLSGGRVMKTYSKRQTLAVDSEPEMEGSGEGADYRAWKKAVMLVYNRLATHKYASAFLRPITEDQAPGYHSIIFRPMDLSTIKKNIDNGTIRSTRHFQRDVMLMFQNAIMYNKHDTFVYKMAITMQEECLQHMQILVQVTGEVSFRRETRTAASSSSEASESGVKKKRSHITPSPHDTDSPRGKKRQKSEND